MIIENVKWLGHDIYKVTYSSDYFQELYDLAVQLIKNDKAYGPGPPGAVKQP
jgi:glutaminyl-tRNA synthetase